MDAARPQGPFARASGDRTSRRATLDDPTLDASDPLASFFWREDEAMEGLAELGPPAPVRRAQDGRDDRREWLTFLLAGEAYAVDIEHAREILKPPEITEVPRAPAHVLGVIMVRGEVIAIFDLRRRLGLPAASPGRRARVLVCDAGDGARGLLVDEVKGVVRLPRSGIEPRPNGIGGGAAEYIQGIGRDMGNLVVLLDLPTVLRDADPASAPERR